MLRRHGTRAEVAEATHRSGGRGAVAIEVLWSNPPLAAQLQPAAGADGTVGRWRE